MSITHIKFPGWQICFDTHFYVRQRCVGSCRWVDGVSEADRVGYSPCSKPLAVEGYLSQQMPERGRCFSSSMRQIPRARFILYLFSYLFIPVQLGASQLHTNTMGQHLPPCAFVWSLCLLSCVGGGGAGAGEQTEGEGRGGTGHQCGNAAVWSRIWASGSQHRKALLAAMWESERKTMRTWRGGCLPLWDCMWILMSW